MYRDWFHPYRVGESARTDTVIGGGCREGTGVSDGGNFFLFGFREKASSLIDNNNICYLVSGYATIWHLFSNLLFCFRLEVFNHKYNRYQTFLFITIKEMNSNPKMHDYSFLFAI